MRTHHSITLSTRAMLLLGLLIFNFTVATNAQAGNQLFEGSWTVKAFGNEITGGSGASAVYSAFGIPQGIQCNPNQPRCPFESTPTNGTGMFHPLGGGKDYALFCAPWYNWQSMGTIARPAKGETATTSRGVGLIPPLYRNPAFFSTSGQPRMTSCSAISRTSKGLPGRVQLGQPITGIWSAVTTGAPGKGGFNFPAALPAHAAGIRTTGRVGLFPAASTHPYRYTYATLRNGQGVFGPGKGAGSFNLLYKSKSGISTLASINVKEGAAKFGGTMRMLGALTTKACYGYTCSLVGKNNWRYDAVGTYAYTVSGIVTQGYFATYIAYYFDIIHGRNVYPVQMFGARFPWTTGSVTVKASGRGHQTVHYANGYDNRNTDGIGTIKLVTPLITHWFQPAIHFKTGGIGILRIKFIPEPHMWSSLVAGVALLGVGYRIRGR